MELRLSSPKNDDLNRLNGFSQPTRTYSLHGGGKSRHDHVLIILDRFCGAALRHTVVGRFTTMFVESTPELFEACGCLHAEVKVSTRGLQWDVQDPALPLASILL